MTISHWIKKNDKKVCFEYQEDNLLNVRIILGVNDIKQLFITPDISLNKIIDHCKWEWHCQDKQINIE